MKVAYRVFSAETAKVEAPVKLPSGQEVVAPVESFEAQLVPTDSDTHGTIKVSFINPDEIAEARAVFVVDKAVTVSFEV